jgi:flavin reductase (DIM6/NTAB) family NADH-FMN oxidoreductase RutF
LNSASQRTLEALTTPASLPPSLAPYRYRWPSAPLHLDQRWRVDEETARYVRDLPENPEELAVDSRWPALFPAPMCIVTTAAGDQIAMEREVGASIVNRFPYVVALSFCREELSHRHHARQRFCEILESGRVAAIQFIEPGAALDRALAVISDYSDADCTRRIAASGLAHTPGLTNRAPVFAASYLAYESKLVQPQVDFDGARIYEQPWLDVGSHRIYFLEINAIQLRQDIAMGNRQILWQALPTWKPSAPPTATARTREQVAAQSRYQKGYSPNYRFPAANTIAFEFDEIRHGMAVKHLPPLPKDQVEVDNDRARWPCFFPSSCGLITTWTADGVPNLMPCGSTTVVSRHPFTIAPCVSYASINERYAARSSLDIIRETGRFGCSVPFIDDVVVGAMKYAGNNSFAIDPQKVLNSGLSTHWSEYGPVLNEAPIHFDCEVSGEVRLGTHIMFLGKVTRVRVRKDVSIANPLEWYPWAATESAAVASHPDKAFEARCSAGVTE